MPKDVARDVKGTKDLNQKERKEVFDSIETSGENEQLGIKLVEKICRSVVGPTLEAAGFEYVKTMVWVRQTKKPIREVFTYKAGHGSRMLPQWGLSLDFVPELITMGTTWHRTQATATISDLRGCAYEGIPETVFMDWTVDYFCSPKQLKTNFQKVSALVLPAMTEFFDKVKSVDDLEKMFRHELQHQHKYPKLGKDLDQQQLAFAFVLAKVGLKAEARKTFDAFMAERKRKSEEKEITLYNEEPFQKLKALFVKELSA